MTKRTIVITQNLDSSLADQLHSALPDWDIIIGRDQSIWEPYIKDAEIIGGWKRPMNELLTDSSNLKWLQSWSAGIDNFPLETFEKRNYLLTSGNGVHANPISETIFALMLGLTRLIHTYVRQQQSKTWHHAGLKLELHGKTIAILGAGAIGKETAKIAKAFGMTVLGVRKSNKDEEYFDKMHSIEQLNEVLPQSDYVVVTLPLTKETNKLFKKEQFELMKDSAFFINIGRGEIVEEKDLIEALQKDKIAGAGLDVFEQEPLDESSPLWEMENVIVTPHTSGATEYYDERIINNIFLPNLKDYLDGKKPSVNLVDFSKGY
ncbi:D-2-hydroxyacid dehydrogenase [Jeotgalibacillus proteolyticus]|uniref:Hydroxyacid dehydrogenase n=1 Tax=Jeotgalibacillus proteolyticus TaxID=2082395 RepID=A0A2S5GCU8_9BACL|nr:D-2-hydroxyacid dehydrogenase [Jeotgalibacillus proteolyticus]PPA70723.1 hydroxyacid dehydrogenase [Jeotgalibacillus proteolyticus]